MRGLLTCLAVLATVLLGVWAYREGYETRAAEREVAALERTIGQRHAELSMLRAEWAYLNRPDRLQALVEMNFERLELMPLAPDHFATIEQVGYAMPEIVLVAAEPVDEEFPEVIIMNHRYGADTQPRMIAPPTLADDGEMLP
jgi:hypothetical protein